MAAQKLEIGAELAQRVEGVDVEEIRRALRHGFGLLPDDIRKGAHRIVPRPARIMLAQARQRRGAQRLALEGGCVEAHEFDIGEEDVVALLLRQLGEHAVVILALEREEPGIVEIFELCARPDRYD